MRTKKIHPSDALMVAAPEAGQPVRLMWLSEAVKELAQASGRRPGDELHGLAASLQDGTLRAYRVQGPNAYASLTTEATVWRPPGAGQWHNYRDRQRAGIAALYAGGMGVWRPEAPLPAVAGLCGLDGLVSIVRGVADNPAGLGHLADLRLAVRVDELQAFKSRCGVQAAAAPASAPVLHVVTAARPAAAGNSDVINEVGLRQRINEHKPMAKRGRRWLDKAAMLVLLLQQYEDRRGLAGAEASICEEKLGTLWNMTPNTVHAYLTEARKAARPDTARRA